MDKNNVCLHEDELYDNILVMGEMSMQSVCIR